MTPQDADQMSAPVLVVSNPDIVSSAPDYTGGDPRHLRRVIEKQPACLLRVATDGMLLAVNEAGLQALGARELSEVLETNLGDRVAQKDHALWTEFVARVG